VIDEVVAPVLHSKLPPDGAVVDKVEVPLQLFTTVTTGVAGTALGADVPLPGALVHPFTVCVTV
jgi:hypothetical protein